MSSHREAPEISKDPVADSTDVYAFVSPDKPGTVTLIANYIPLQGPAGGPNWNRRQSYDVTVVSEGSARAIGSGLACPPCNIGPLSTPDYAALAAQAVHSLGGGITVFAGQRAKAFYVDLGSIFDLGDLRPFANLHATFGLPALEAGPGVNATNHLNVHSIAIQVPISSVAGSGRPTIGVWTTASRQRVRVWDADNGENVDSGPFRQVSRLGNPLVYEVLIPLGRKDQWNSLPPSDDKLSSPPTWPIRASRRSRGPWLPAHALEGPAASHARPDQVCGRPPGPAGRALHGLAGRAQCGGHGHRHRRAGQLLPLARLRPIPEGRLPR